MAGLDALDEVVVLSLGHGVDKVNASLVKGENIGGGKNADVRGDNGSGLYSLAVAGNGHVTHDVDVGDVLAEVVDHRFRGFGHTLHELFLGNIPLVGLAGSGVYPCFTDATVGAPDADILVATAKATLGVAFEMSEDDKGIVIEDMAAHGHTGEPFTAADGKSDGILLIEDVNGTKVPAVDLQGLAVLLGGVTVADVVGVGLNDRCIREFFLDEGLNPIAGDDVRAVLLASMELDADTPGDVAGHLPVGIHEALGGELTGEVNDGLVAGTLVGGNVFVAVTAGGRLIVGSGLSDGGCPRDEEAEDDG